ncbi:hypothetical protein [Streptosporangium amethystogenes]|uniref:hypothetical protein n=1 Tax=Streptosporangium amethystogenes TaxID=2002 RepID=UPI0004C74BAC|nr:hypothetical protein [Streptosporangium amethystogenes]
MASDEAAGADARPSDLRGKILAYVTGGTAKNDGLPAELEYARHLRDHPVDAQVFLVPQGYHDGTVARPRRIPPTRSRSARCR